MTVKNLLEILSEFEESLEVTIAVSNNDGCSTCGWGATSSGDTPDIYDLETRIVIAPTGTYINK